MSGDGGNAPPFDNKIHNTLSIMKMYESIAKCNAEKVTNKTTMTTPAIQPNEAGPNGIEEVVGRAGAVCTQGMQTQSSTTTRLRQSLIYSGWPPPMRLVTDEVDSPSPVCPCPIVCVN